MSQIFTHNFVVPPKLVPAERMIEGRGYEDEEGNFYPGVTSWIGSHWDKAFLEKWRARVGVEEAAKITKRAGDRGHNLHTVVESYIRNLEIDFQGLDMLTKTMYAKIKPLVCRINNIRLIETPIYSKSLGLAGRPDVIADYNGLLAVIDFKTSIHKKKKAWVVDYFLQTACYARMFYELYGEMPRQSVLMVAVEDEIAPQLLVEPMDVCLKMLDKFKADPVAFQKKLNS
jgi:hypothetical protein